MEDRLQRVFEAIDEINQQDPNHETYEGQVYPKELIYGKRMTETLTDFVDKPSELLQIAARGQHIKRWHIPRNAYPMDRNGYLKWRSSLKLMHADLLEGIMNTQGYSKEEVKTVRDLVIKKGLKTNVETQILEDVICLVFLKYQFETFAVKHDDEKIVSIVQKTWKKMSEKGQKEALKLTLSERTLTLVKQALKN